VLGQVVEIDVLEMSRPDDASGLRELLERRPVEDIIAIIGKTEGSGLVKDPARETADRVIKELLAERLGIRVEQVAERVCMVLSGGSPGVITPHVAVITRSRVEGAEAGRPDEECRLVVGLAHSQPIEPHEVGRTGQINKVRDAVQQALRDAQLDDPTMVHAVLVKAPALTEEGIAAAARAGHDTVTRDLGIGPEGAMCFSNDASALGVAVALGEVREDEVTDAIVRTDFSLYSDVAMTSSGGEKTHAEVLVLGNGSAGSGSLRAGHSSMRDILDLAAVGRAMAVADPSGSATPDDVVYMMGKMIIPGSPTLRGRRITLHDDPVGYHVAKAMGGYLLAATTGRTCSFMSGGEQNSHQGPPDGNPLAAIVRVDQR
jgi:cyanuric acid amidohydrolase